MILQFSMCFMPTVPIALLNQSYLGSFCHFSLRSESFSDKLIPNCLFCFASFTQNL